MKRIFIILLPLLFFSGCVTSYYEAMHEYDYLAPNYVKTVTFENNQTSKQEVLDNIKTYNNYKNCQSMITMSNLSSEDGLSAVLACREARESDLKSMNNFLQYLLNIIKNPNIKKDKKLLSKIYYQIGVLYNNLNDKINSKHYLLKALKIDKSLKLSKSVVKDYITLATMNLNNPKTLRKYTLNGLNYLNKHKNSFNKKEFIKNKIKFIEYLYSLELIKKHYSKAFYYLKLKLKYKVQLAKLNNEDKFMIEDIYKEYYLTKARIYKKFNKRKSRLEYQNYFKSCKKYQILASQSGMIKNVDFSFISDCKASNLYIPCVKDLNVYFEYADVDKKYNKFSFFLETIPKYINKYKKPIIKGSKFYVPGYYGDYYLDLAELFYKRGQYDYALKYLEEADKFVGIVDYQSRPKYKLMLANLKFYNKKYFSSWFDYETVLTDPVRGYLHKKFEILLESPQKQKKYMETLKNIYHNMMFTSKNCLDEPLMDKTIYYIINNDKNMLFDVENILYKTYYSTNNEDLKKEIKKYFKLKQEISRLYLLPQTPLTKENIKILKASIRGLYNDLYLKLNLNVDIRRKDFKKYLKDDELFIDIISSENGYLILYLDNANYTGWNILNKEQTKKLDSYVKEYVDIINKLKSNPKNHKLNRKIKIISYTLYNKIFGFLENDSNMPLNRYKKIIIANDGKFNYIPFSSLYVKHKRKYFGEYKTIIYVPSFKYLVLNNKNKQLKNHKAVIFADPMFNKNIKSKSINRALYISHKNKQKNNLFSYFKGLYFPSLPGTLKEANIIDNILKNNKYSSIEYLKSDANEYNLFKINSPEILHIATHGFYIKSNKIINPMLKSGIALTGANIGANKHKPIGIITALKLSGINLQNTNLVVLSACETGVIDINSNSSISALNTAFLSAGSSNVISTLWEISDRETIHFMKIFYENYLKFNSVQKALQATKIRMIKEHKPIIYWAPFILYGK